MTKKKREKKDKELSLKGNSLSGTEQKFDLTSKIEELEILEQKSLILGNYNEALMYLEQIIDLAKKGKLTTYIKEQQKILTLITDKVKKEHAITEVTSIGMGIKKIYETLIANNQIKQAHEILEEYIKKYENITDMYSIPLLKDLIKKDNKLWTQYRISKSKNN